MGGKLIKPKLLSRLRIDHRFPSHKIRLFPPPPPPPPPPPSKMGSFFSSLVTPPPEAASSESSRVLEFHSSNRWQLHFNNSKQSNKLIVIDFSATWCGPCKMMEPVLNALSSKYSDVDFVKIDVDQLSDVSQQFGVQAMPTFVLLKQGKEIDRIVGAKKDELERKIVSHREAPKFAK